MLSRTCVGLTRLAAFAGLAAVGWALAAGTGRAQEKTPAPRAAVVNGQAIPESDVQRQLRSIPKEQQDKVRPEVIRVLIDNVLLDQYLIQLKVAVSKDQVESQIKELKDELLKNKKTYEDFLKQVQLTDEELRTHLTAEVRWENHVKGQVTDKLLQDFFAKNKEWFDESLVRASHILVQVSPDADAKAREAAKAKLLGLKKQIEDQAAKELAKLDPKADNLAREQARLKALTDAFAEAAKGSDCPSKAKGGDLGYFPRVGAMVEPFAAAAFALQPGQLSGVVETQFGYHLILLTQRQPGKDVKYDDLKDEVREVYAAKLRADLLPKLRKEAKIEITPK